MPIFAIMALAIIGCTIQNTVLAQSTDKSGNQTSAEITGTPESTIVNKTTIPAQQTTVTVNKTTSSTDQSSLQPLQKQQLGNPNMDLSGFENKTVLQPTGEANTTTINKTSVPFEQTTIENQTGTPQQQQQSTSGAASSAGKLANQTGEAIQGNASELGANVSKGAQNLGKNITEGAKGLAETIGKGLQDLAK